MKRLFFASISSAAVLVVTGCTAASGPTFNAYSVDSNNAARIYRAECHGLFEGASTCMDVARRICGDKPVQVIDKMDVVRTADDRRSDSRVLHFKCGEVLSNKAPADIGAVVAQTATLESFSLESDTLFPFGKSSRESMLPAAKARLDEIAARIRQHEHVSAITVVGHTDRLGPESINGPLSLARANTVRDYLVAHGLDGSIVLAKGVGSSEPRTHCAEHDARALIACLQEDRYVSITVEGRK
uniref:OmpA/MotB domain protein n=1 Tax=Burkholderia sp. (strain CCGE1003) TaxID=640512 RepID=E1T4Z2_BURSG